MMRVRVDDELLDIPTDFTFTAMSMARAVRPGAVVVSDTRGGPHELADDADTALYTGDKVAHWTHPGLTGEITETEVPRYGPRFHWVEWPSQNEPGITLDPVAYFADSLIRVTPLEN